MGCVSREETTHLAWRSRQFYDVLSVFVACHSRSLFLPPLLPGRHVVRFCQSRTRAQGYEWLQADGKTENKVFSLFLKCFLFSSRPATRYLLIVSFSMFFFWPSVLEISEEIFHTVVELSIAACSLKRDHLIKLKIAILVPVAKSLSLFSA